MPASKMTKSGTALMAAIGRREFSFFDGGIVEGEGIWSECLTAEAAGTDIAKTAKGVAQVVRGLSDQGYLVVEETGEESPWVTLTALGAETALRLAGVTVEPEAANDAEVSTQDYIENPDDEPVSAPAPVIAPEPTKHAKTEVRGICSCGWVSPKADRTAAISLGQHIKRAVGFDEDRVAVEADTDVEF